MEDFGSLHVWNYFQFKNYNCFFERTIWKILALYMFEVISNLRITILMKWNSFFEGTIWKILALYMFEIISNLRITILRSYMKRIVPLWGDNLEDFGSLFFILYFFIHVWNYFEFKNYDFIKIVSSGIFQSFRNYFKFENYILLK